MRRSGIDSGGRSGRTGLEPKNWSQNEHVFHLTVAVGLPVRARGPQRWKPELPGVTLHFPSSANASGITFPELAGSVSESVLLNDGGGEQPREDPTF